MNHLFVDISSHGLGHLAQAAPVLNALRRARPGLRLTIRSGLPAERLARRIDGPFRHLAEASDFGFVMRNALDIDLEASGRRYRDFHADWPARVEREAAQIKALGADLVLSDVACLPLAGAAAAGIPAVALCSLHWASMFGHYFGAEPWAEAIHAQMLAAYRGAAVFLRPMPGMAMPELGNVVDIGPIAAPAMLTRAEVAARLGLPAGRRWVLVALGGFDFPLPVAAWPRRDDILWIVPMAWQARRDDVVGFDDAHLPFADLLAAADAAITKPGYGTIAEAGVHGVPLLYLRRPDWPEEACLIDWISRHGRAAEVSRGEAARGELPAALDALWARPAPPPPAATGIADAVTTLLRHLPAGC